MSVLKIKNANQNWESIPAIKGENAKINGVNTLLIEAGTNITLDQEGNTLTINSTASGGSSDYEDLENLPKINNIELKGNKSLNDLGIQPIGNYALESDIPDVSNFITNSVNNLLNYYLKSETYTKQEVNNLIGQIATLQFQVVTTLPQTGDSKYIYLVPSSNPKTQNVKDEYIWVNNAWEKIGNTEIDLTGYATENWVNTQISEFLTQSQIQALISTSLSDYALESDIPTKTSDLTNDSGFLTSHQDLSNYVTLNGTQTITGGKTFNNTFTMSNVNNAKYISNNTSNIRPDITALSNPPWNKDLWHDHFALLRFHSIYSQEVTTDGTNWVTENKTINGLFSQKENNSIIILTPSELGYRFTLKNSSFAYSGLSWFEIAVGYTKIFSQFDVLIQHSSDNENWSNCHHSVITGNSEPYFLRNGYTIATDGYTRFTFTKTTNITTGSVALASIKGFCTRKGGQGLGSEIEYPYDWDLNLNVLPVENNAKTLGSSSKKWLNVYATTFTGSLSGNASTATKATQDSDGNAINTTYAKVASLENYVTKTNYATNDTSGVIKVSTNNGFSMTNGNLRASTITYENYLNAQNNTNIGKATLENVITGKGLDLKQLPSYDNTKTQVLKNINGTLTWVDES